MSPKRMRTSLDFMRYTPYVCFSMVSCIRIPWHELGVKRNMHLEQLHQVTDEIFIEHRVGKSG